jgi:hypothetical protein
LTEPCNLQSILDKIRGVKEKKSISLEEIEEGEEK